MGSALFGSTAQFSDVLEFGHFTAARTKTPQADSTCAANFASHNRRHENRSAALIYIKFRMGNALHNLLPDIEDPADCTSTGKHLQWRRDFNERSGRHLMSPFGPKPKCRTVRDLVAIGWKADVTRTSNREITNGRGVELILDAIGGDSFRKGYRLLAPTGRLGMFGISAAVIQKQRRIRDMIVLLARTPWFQFNPLSLINANKGVFGVNLGHLWGEVDRIRGWGDQLLDLWAQGVIKPKIAQSFKFDEASVAHQFIQDRLDLRLFQQNRPKPTNAGT